MNQVEITYAISTAVDATNGRYFEFITKFHLKHNLKTLCDIYYDAHQRAQHVIIGTGHGGNFVYSCLNGHCDE